MLPSTARIRTTHTGGREKHGSRETLFVRGFGRKKRQ